MSALSKQDSKFASLGLSKSELGEKEVGGEGYVNAYMRGLDSVAVGNPVLVLLHGYPQSSYMWRNLIPYLPPTSPLYVPDLPGYGASTAPTGQHDKLSVGKIIISALKAAVSQAKGTKEGDDLHIVLIGHDRGARVAHRLAVSEGELEGVKVRGVVMVDIVPTTTQWRTSGTSPRELTTYWHWPFLANPSTATPLITAYTGSRWCKTMIASWAGTSAAGLSNLHSSSALDIYAEFMDDPAVIEASCKDYEAGATTDVEMQKVDQESGKKIGVGVLLVWSEANLGKRYDVFGEWRDWVADGVEVEGLALGDGIGHFGAEEAPRETGEAVVKWLKKVVG
ncbi:unnamed protein product [Periconia digitata]|uniref:AB hydrolase-1 domain-containing protein n=1 Tax=Periconia digitata TaxID=1303443 RepID=A0A9W4UFD0_9PLEO|nr:unnamed protein product [Periconia digitata]